MSGPSVERLRFPGLDGLRAVAIAGVLLYHASVSWMPGGFLGVDVFFVLSGYLITSLLLGEVQRTRRLDFAKFYVRRARRLLPGLLLMLLTTVSYASMFARDAIPQLRGDVPAALGYVSNWWFVAQSHSYFLEVNRSPLLQHLWSLAVEEQFYLVWPLVLWLVVRRRHTSFLSRRFVRRIAFTGALLSSAWMAIVAVRAGMPITTDPSRAYFGTDTHAFGVLLGSAVATSWQLRRPRRSVSSLARWVLDGVGVAALLVVVWAYLAVDQYSPTLYHGGFLALDVAVAVLIAVLVEPAARIGSYLGRQPLRWLGLRSYGIYLWHWPVFMVTRPGLDIGLRGSANLVLRLAVTFGLAELSWRYVEVPVRRLGFRAFVRGLRPRWLRLTPALYRPAVPVGLAAVVLLAGCGLYLGPVPEVSTTASSPDQGSSLEPPRSSPTSPDRAARATSPPAPAHLPLLAPYGVPVDPAWPKTMTVITDSVLLGTKQALPAALPGWKVDYRGHVAVMAGGAVASLQETHQPVGSVVVVGLGYNSLWQPDRTRYARWAKVFDRQARQLDTTLTALGAKKIIWVTLRDASMSNIPASARWQQQKYAWYFPYVNERLRALVHQYPALGLADWAAVSNRPGITYDAIHLNPRGAALMAATIRATLSPQRTAGTPLRVSPAPTARPS